MAILKKHYIHIVFSWILLANLFSQAALNFFHRHEERITSYGKSIKADKPDCHSSVLYEEHKEFCKVCGLDLFHELFAEELPLFNFSPKIYSAYYNYPESFSLTYCLHGTSRAPPIHSSLS